MPYASKTKTAARVLVDSCSSMASTRAAADGEEGLYCAREYALDLAIVDLGLPKLNGMELIKKLRAEGKSYPVLILTARDKWQDKVEGLQAGADDYLAKPFHFEELLARMQALLRRSGALGATGVALWRSRARSAHAGSDGQRPARRPHQLEYRILEYLIHRAGEVISKAS